MSEDKYGKYEDDPQAWLRKVARAHWEETQMQMQNRVMNVYEHFALSEYLYAFPEDKTYDEVLDMLVDMNDEVIVWEVFDDVMPEVVVELIDALKDRLFGTFVSREAMP